MSEAIAPSDAVRPLAVRHVLRFEVAAETLATFRHAMKQPRQQTSEHLDDDAALLLLDSTHFRRLVMASSLRGVARWDGRRSRGSGCFRQAPAR